MQICGQRVFTSLNMPIVIECFHQFCSYVIILEICIWFASFRLIQVNGGLGLEKIINHIVWCSIS